MKNKYFIRSRISEKKFREIIKLFSADLTATQIAFLSGVSRPTINKILKQIRMRRERDSNPRDSFLPTRFPSVRLQPLGHLSY